LGPIDRASLCLQTSAPAAAPVAVIKPTQYKPSMSVNISPTRLIGSLYCVSFINRIGVVAGVERQRLALCSGLHQNTETEFSLRNVVSNKRQDDG
jgi:hypothetical protein